jgi:protein TonB
VNAFSLYDNGPRRFPSRWGLSAAVIFALHGGLVALGVAWARHTPVPGTTAPMVMIDMTPAAAAPEASPPEEAPGPLMQQAETVQPDAPIEAKPEPIAPTPPQIKPEVVAPSKPIEAKPTPPKPKTEVRQPPKPPAREASVAAPRTSAPPSAARRAPQSASMSGDTSAAMTPQYRQLLAAHLQRFKQYPAGAKAAGQQGVAMLSFTVTRNGGVSGSRLSQSSGQPALDAEAMAMIRRAQPLPAFLPGMTQASLSFTVPVSFSIRN